MVIARPFAARSIGVTNSKVFGFQVDLFQTTIFLHLTEGRIGVAIISTNWPDYRFTILVAYTIGDALFVNLTLLSVITTEQIALVQPLIRERQKKREL